MALYHNMTELIGNTPLLKLTRMTEDCKADIFVKLECFNPAGSIKDRAALSMILEAEKQGILQKGGTIIESTSGNTGIGLAAIGTARGYRVILTMPETMSVERRNLLKAYGAELVLTPGSEGMNGAVKKAEELLSEIHGSMMMGQFENEANPKAHYETTGPEIWRDTEGKVDVLVAGVGTGGTLSGTGRYLKEQKSSVEVVAVEPKKSPLLSGGAPSGHGIQGIGANFIPKNFDASVCDRVMQVTEEEAYEAARSLVRHAGLLVGISSGAALSAAITLAKLPEYAGKTIVAVLPDTGERYLSTPLFAEG